jgi:transposase
MKVDGRRLDHATLETIRKMAMRRVREGESPSAVIASYGFCRPTIYKWLRQVAGRTVEEAMRSRKATGRPRRLTAAQERKVYRWLNGRDPRQYGFDFGLWTRRLVSRLIAERFGVELGVTAVGQLLAKLNLTPQKPLTRAYERDPVAIAAWQRDVYPRLARRAKRLGANIYFWDEAGFRTDAAQGRTWGVKGQTPVVTRSGQRQSASAASAVNAKGGFWFATYRGGMTAGVFCELLRKLMNGRRQPLFLVLDSLPAHKAKLVRKYVASTKGRLELHFLPHYAPELNPDELVWNHLKRTGTARRPLTQGEKLRHRVAADLLAIKHRPSLVRSFFRAPAVAYIID